MGWVIYLVVIAGALYFGSELSKESKGAADGWEGKEWMLAPMMAGIAFMILTIWRNIFISAGVLTRGTVQEGEAPGGGSGVKSGINWVGIILVMISVGVARHYTQKMTRKMQYERYEKQRKEGQERLEKARQRQRPPFRRPETTERRRP